MNGLSPEIQEVADRRDASVDWIVSIVTCVFCAVLLLLLLIAGEATTGPAGLRLSLPPSAHYVGGSGDFPGYISSEGNPKIYIFGYSLAEREVVADLQKKEGSPFGTTPDVWEKKTFAVDGMRGERFFISTPTGISTYYLLNIDKPRVLVTVAHSPYNLNPSDQQYFKEVIKSIAQGNSASNHKGIPLLFLLLGLIFPRGVMLFTWCLGSLPYHNIPLVGSILALLITPRLLIAAYTFQNEQYVWCVIFIIAQNLVSKRPVKIFLITLVNWYVEQRSTLKG